jgi:transposase
MEMVTIGIDPHKHSHAAAAVDEVGKQLAEQTARATELGFVELLDWARGLDSERVWVLEDCRHVSGPLERFLIDRGETVVRLAPHLMADARRGVRERGKSDPIDALAVARAALREGLETLPTAHLAGVELEIRLLSAHHQRLVKARSALICDLRWQLHDLWPELEIGPRTLIWPGIQGRLANRLAKATPTARVRIARDELRRIRELSRTINQLHEELATLVRETAPHLLAETGVGPITAARLLGEIAGIERFASDAKLARIAGCAPVPISSGKTSRYRLDRGGNRNLNHAIHIIALSRIRHDPQTALYMAKQRQNGKTQREALRCLKRQVVRRIYRVLSDPAGTPTTVCLT